MCAWVRISLLSKFAFKKPTFWSKQYFWESNQEQDEADFTLQEGVIEDRMKQVRYTQSRMAERCKAPDSRKSPLRLLVHECVRGFESHSCQNLRSKANILVKAGVLRVERDARQTDFTLQEGVSEDRMKQMWYTQGRMAERSKAPESRNSPLRLLVHECVRGFESHSCQILRSKRQHFNRSSIESHSCQILRSKS